MIELATIIAVIYNNSIKCQVNNDERIRSLQAVFRALKLQLVQVPEQTQQLEYTSYSKISMHHCSSRDHLCSPVGDLKLSRDFDVEDNGSSRRRPVSYPVARTPKGSISSMYSTEDLCLR